MPETTYHQEGDLIDFTPGADVKAGDVEFLGTIAGQVVTDLVSGQLGALRVRGVIKVPKASATVFALGAAVHWNDGTALAVNSGGAGAMGKAVGGGADGDDYVNCLLNA